MRAGRLDTPVTFYRITAERQLDGGSKDILVKFADGWGDIIERPGSDRFEADQRTARQLLTLEVRFVYGLTPRMLVRVNAAMFEIENVAEVQRNRRLLLTCYSHEVEIPPTAQAAQG